MKKQYYATQDRNGTEDEIAICTPDGREIAVIWFWDENDEITKPINDQKKKDAELIVTALNFYKKHQPRQERAARKAALEAIKAAEKCAAECEKDDANIFAA